MKTFMIFCSLLFAVALVRADTLICFGDSQTAVRPPVTDADTYCAKMAARTGKSHINAGVGGDTTQTALLRLAGVLASPGSCVTVMLGANDAFISPYATYDYTSYWSGPKPSIVTIQQYKANMNLILDMILGAGKQVTLITPWAFFSTPNLIQFTFYVDALKTLAGVRGAPLLDADAIQRNLWWASSPWLNGPSLWLLESDYQHPSALGHTKIADLCQLEQNKTACACAL